MELDERFLHPCTGHSVRDQGSLVKFWQEPKEKFKEGPYVRPTSRC